VGLDLQVQLVLQAITEIKVRKELLVLLVHQDQLETLVLLVLQELKDRKVK
jgi:hypothetical protein